MTAGTQPWSRDQPSRRRSSRYPVQAPLDVTVLRSGVPDTVPGRSINLGEGGVAAVLAGELLPGEAVGVEIRLPVATNALRTRALVRHHDKLHSGLEFIGLSAEQQGAIRDWAGQTKALPEAGVRPQPAVEPEKDYWTSGGGGGGPQPPARKRSGRLWLALLLSVLIFVAGVWWWQWNRGWQDLESSLQKNEVTMQRPQAHVPADVMQKLVIHRVDPDYPAAARTAKLQGVIALDVVIGRDGSVVDVRALNGPDILAQSAINALRWWRFQPYRVDGQPAVVETTVAVEFKP